MISRWAIFAFSKKVSFLFKQLHAHCTKFFRHLTQPLQVARGTVPWGAILTSPPVWGIIAAAFASDWGLYVLLICVPLFLMDILHYEVAAVSLKDFGELIRLSFSVSTGVRLRQC